MNKHASVNISLKVFLRNSVGQILVLKTSNDSTFFGAYDFPGGRIDEGEYMNSITSIIGREMKEEIGNITFKLYPQPVTLGRHIGQQKQGKVVVFYNFFEADYISGDIQISPEHTKYKWLDLETIVLDEYFNSGMLEAVTLYINGRTKR